MIISEPLIVTHTQNWIQQVVIGLNFCPFAAQPFKQKTINYTVSEAVQTKEALTDTAIYIHQLLENETIETGLLIFEKGFTDFKGYLQLVDLAEQLLVAEDKEGIFQIASFHPQYIFHGSNDKDAANYTNRSPYPMLHFLRENSLEALIALHKNTANIPKNNIELCNQKGLAFMQNLLQQTVS